MIGADDFCPHGFPVAAHCIGCDDDARRLGLGSPEKVTIVATFYAPRYGDCFHCNDPVHIGQVVHRLSNGRYVHAGCES